MDSRRIIVDIRQMTASISTEEATASPTTAAALQEARGHLLRASMAVERVQKGASWKDVADDLITQAQAEQLPYPRDADYEGAMAGLFDPHQIEVSPEIIEQSTQQAAAYTELGA